MDAETHFIYNKRNAKQFAIEALNNYDINVEFTDSGAAIISEPILNTEVFDDRIAKLEAEIAELEAMTDEQYRDSLNRQHKTHLQKLILRTHKTIEEETILSLELEKFKKFNPPKAVHTLRESNIKAAIIDELQSTLQSLSSTIRSHQGLCRVITDDLVNTSLEDISDLRQELIKNAKSSLRYNTEQRDSEIKEHNEKVKFLSEYIQEVERCFGEGKE